MTKKTIYKLINKLKSNEKKNSVIFLIIFILFCMYTPIGFLQRYNTIIIILHLSIVITYNSKITERVSVTKNFKKIERSIISKTLC